MMNAEAQAVIFQGRLDPYRPISLELAAKHRLPIMSGNQETAAGGGLISYSAKFAALYEQAAVYSISFSRVRKRPTFL
jgi:hypothetical protein